MKIGVCTSVNNIKKIEAMGFDYLEPSVVSVASMEESEFKTIIQLVRECKIRCEVFNGLFPSDIRLTGIDVNIDKIKSYIDKAFNRISIIGAKVVVFGSGGSRKLPEGWDYKEGWKQLVRISNLVGEMAAQYELYIAMEPLNKKETNILNSITEGIKFVKEVNHPNIKLLADFYHMRMENESMNVLIDAAPILQHLHIANSNGRIYPMKISEDIYDDFFATLKKIGYRRRISIEANTLNIDKDAPIALKFLRELIKKYAEN